jgi:hypothetical protein
MYARMRSRGHTNQSHLPEMSKVGLLRVLKLAGWSVERPEGRLVLHLSLGSDGTDLRQP